MSMFGAQFVDLLPTVISFPTATSQKHRLLLSAVSIKKFQSDLVPVLRGDDGYKLVNGDRHQKAEQGQVPQTGGMHNLARWA